MQRRVRGFRQNRLLTPPLSSVGDGGEGVGKPVMGMFSTKQPEYLPDADFSVVACDNRDHRLARFMLISVQSALFYEDSIH